MDWISKCTCIHERHKGIFTYLREVPNKVSGKPIVEKEALILACLRHSGNPRWRPLRRPREKSTTLSFLAENKQIILVIINVVIKWSWIYFFFIIVRTELAFDCLEILTSRFKNSPDLYKIQLEHLVSYYSNFHLIRNTENILGEFWLLIKDLKMTFPPLRPTANQ